MSRFSKNIIEPPSGHEGGFSAVELLVVFAIVATVTGIAVPALMSWLPTLRLNSAAQQVATDLQVARMKAISQNASYTVTFNVSTGTYTYGNDSRNMTTLFPGITIASASNPTFTPRGTVNAVTISLSNGSAQKLICVKTMGRVSISNATCT
jgi:Tfp pilus assembly protein FimT